MSKETFKSIDRVSSIAALRDFIDRGGRNISKFARDHGVPYSTAMRWASDVRSGAEPRIDATRGPRKTNSGVCMHQERLTLTRREKERQAEARKGPSEFFPRATIYPAPPKNHFDMPWPHYWQAMHGHAMTWADVRGRKQKKVVITSAQMATPAHAGFFQSLLAYCFRECAALVVIPFRYRNPTSQWTEGQEDHEWLAPELLRYEINTREELCKNLVLAAHIPIQPTAVSPLSGLDTMGPQSMIFGSCKLELSTVPVPSSSMPKIITTTGAITHPDFTNTKAGAKGAFHHCLGAVVVEIDGDKFYLRQLGAENDGSFIDLQSKYSPFGAEPAGNAAALVLGDTHTRFKDESVHDATFLMNDSIVDHLAPSLIAVHDLSDLQSNNTHHAKNQFKVQFRKHVAKQSNVEEEVNEAAEFLDEIASQRKWRQILVVPSNHTDHLSDWIDNFKIKEDLENAEFWNYLVNEFFKSTRAGENFDAFIHCMKTRAKSVNQLILPYRDESHSVLGIELGMHGDKGPNGSRGSRRNLDKIGVKSIVGHSHSPGIFGGTWQTGTSSKLRMGYNSGPSSWMHTHCVVYSNGHRALINIIHGKWKMEWDVEEKKWARNMADSLSVESPMMLSKP